MWLPQDERRLLRHYHQAIDQVGKERDYSLKDLVEVLYCIKTKELSDHREREGEENFQLARWTHVLTILQCNL